MREGGQERVYKREEKRNKRHEQSHHNNETLQPFSTHVPNGFVVFPVFP